LTAFFKAVVASSVKFMPLSSVNFVHGRPAGLAALVDVRQVGETQAACAEVEVAQVIAFVINEAIFSECLEICSEKTGR
jgi:hypothetical protein